MKFQRILIIFIIIATGLILWVLLANGQTEPIRVDEKGNVVSGAEKVRFPEPSHAFVVPGKIALKWEFHGESRVWLEVATADKQAWPKEGYNPSFTVILTQYKPIVIQREDGKYEVTFTQGNVKMP